MTKDKQFKPDTPEDILYFIVGILLAATLTYYNYPEIQLKVTEYQVSKYADFSGNSITFPSTFVERVATDYNNKRFEIAYCFAVNGNKVVKLFTADIRAASASDVIFYCPSFADGTIHTHPSRYPLPSEADVGDFMDSEFDVMCIYSGVLNCWSKEGEKLKGVEVITK